MLADGKRGVGDNIHPRGRPMRGFGPENLRERDRLRQRFIVKSRQQNRVTAGIAQGDRLRCQARLAALGLVASEEVTFEAALSRGCAGGFVEADARDEQGGDGIYQGGFSRADIAGDQSVVAADVEAPDLFVERSPIQDFYAHQTEAGAWGFRSQGRTVPFRRLLPGAETRSRRKSSLERRLQARLPAP